MTDIATFTNEQLIAVCRADVAEMSKFLKEGEFSNPSRAAMYLRITEIALAALMGEFSFARNQVRREHAEWSKATFGNVGPVGPLNHLSKEALEAAAEPGDLSEWADMQFLLWDAQHRAGITDEQITQAMIDKLAVHKTALMAGAERRRAAVAHQRAASAGSAGSTGFQKTGSRTG